MKSKFIWNELIRISIGCLLQHHTVISSHSIDSNIIFSWSSSRATNVFCCFVYQPVTLPLTTSPDCCCAVILNNLLSDCLIYYDFILYYTFKCVPVPVFDWILHVCIAIIIKIIIIILIVESSSCKSINILLIN